jgi:hypothetical protein
MPNRSSAKTDLNLLAATSVEDPVTPVFLEQSTREEPQSGGEKTGARGFRDRLWTDVGL